MTLPESLLIVHVFTEVLPLWLVEIQIILSLEVISGKTFGFQISNNCCLPENLSCLVSGDFHTTHIGWKWTPMPISQIFLFIGPFFWALWPSNSILFVLSSFQSLVPQLTDITWLHLGSPFYNCSPEITLKQEVWIMVGCTWFPFFQGSKSWNSCHSISNIVISYILSSFLVVNIRWKNDSHPPMFGSSKLNYHYF